MQMKQQQIMQQQLLEEVGKRQKYKNTKIQIHKYIYTNTFTQMHLHKLQLLEVVGKRQNMPFCISLFSIFIQIGASLTLASFLTDEFVLSPFSSITRRTAPSFTPNTRSRYLPFCRLDHFSHNIISIIFQTQFSRTQTKSPKN